MFDCDAALLEPLTNTRVSVLIIEDEPVSRRALTALVAARGHHVTAVGSAEDALTRVRDGSRPSVAIVDLELPGMDGMEFIRRVRAISDDIFAILMTAANAETIERLKNGTSVSCVRKPLDIKHLMDLITDRDHGN